MRRILTCTYQRVSRLNYTHSSLLTTQSTRVRQNLLQQSTPPSITSNVSNLRHNFHSQPAYFAPRSRMSAPVSENVERLLDQARAQITDLVLTVVPLAFPEVTGVDELKEDVYNKTTKVASGARGQGDLALGCFAFAKKIKGPPMKTAEVLGAALTDYLAKTPHATIVSAKAAGPYINFTMSVGFMAQVLTHIQSGAYLKARSKAGHAKVMIEYSQPNTHKAFHVGHMRNAALGDCLVRLYEQLGHEVVATNYFGDEGAHVAKCLWFLREYLKSIPQFNIDTDVAPEQRGEWLGAMYSSSVEALDLGTLTAYPFPNIIAAKVLKVENHPSADAPPNWHVVTLQIDAAGKEATVVCGGKGYQVGDLVAYTPVGAKLAKGVVVEPKDMKGVSSQGIIMASRELGIEEPTPAPAAATEEKSKEKPAKAPKEAKQPAAPKEKAPKADKAEKKDDATSSTAAPKEKKENKGKGKDERESPNNLIHLFPASTPVGVEVAEFGRKAAPSQAELDKDAKLGKYYLPMPPASKSVIAEWEERKLAVKQMLLALETGSDPKISDLWAKTKAWSLNEFKNIYAWLNVRFDHDFYESECSEPSRKLVEDYRNKVFFDSNGALGADLSKYNLGFCMVLKSDGSGLYATKDLALAKRKFDEFGIDTSIYIVDAAQTLHFKQVFKTLELMGYERAKNCVHIPYGQVVLPDGKMSSRKGTVIFFSQLRNLLNQDIYANFLAKYDPDRPADAAPAPEVITGADGKTWTKQEKNVAKWTKAELAEAQQQIAVATIKYGMLNHDVAKDIVFVLEEWTAKSGNTGPYMLYAYARIQSIIREVKVSPDAKVDFSLLTHDSDRIILTLLHEFWDILDKAVELKNPSTLCGYLFELSKSFSSWYEIPACSVNNAATEDLKATRVEFIRCVAKVIQHGLGLLGIKTLERM